MTQEALTKFALYIVWVCALIGILATLSKYVTDGTIESTTLVFSLIALLLSLPTYRQWKRKKIAQKLEL